MRGYMILISHPVIAAGWDHLFHDSVLGGLWGRRSLLYQY
jgi:hypothetical protein